MNERRRPVFALAVFGTIVVACLTFSYLMFRSVDPNRPRNGSKVGVVDLEGPIMRSQATLATLRKFRRDRTIKAVVIRVNSPGGAVGPAQEIYREIKRVRKKKPVVASLGSVAASGGYYIAAACQKIIAAAGTLTGSIGVITQTSDVSALLKFAQVRTETLKSGRFKDTGSPLRKMTADDRELLQRLVDAIHGQFVRDVAKGRKLKLAEVLPIADGRILTGEGALALKLVDQIGNFSDALDAAVKASGEKNEAIPVYDRKDKGILNLLVGDSARTLAADLRLALLGGLEPRVQVREDLTAGGL